MSKYIKEAGWLPAFPVWHWHLSITGFLPKDPGLLKTGLQTQITMNLLFKALNDATRREILTLLKEGDKTAGEIAEHFRISKPSISHHLDLLKQAGLVEAEKQGQFILYSLNTTVVDEIAQWFIQFKTKKKQ